LFTFSGNPSKRFELPFSFGGVGSPDLMSMSNSVFPPHPKNGALTRNIKSFRRSESLSPSNQDSDEQNGFTVPGNPEIAGSEAPSDPQPLPEASSFNMNEKSADKVMKQVDTFSQSHPDVADTVLKHLSSMNASEMPDDSKIVNNLPLEMKNELQPEEHSLAEDDASRKGSVAQSQAQASDNLMSVLTNIANKESGESSAVLKQQAEIDSIDEKTLNGGSKAPEKQGT